jgi:chromosome segregation ATPase
MLHGNPYDELSAQILQYRADLEDTDRVIRTAEQRLADAKEEVQRERRAARAEQVRVQIRELRQERPLRTEFHTAVRTIVDTVDKLLEAVRDTQARRDQRHGMESELAHLEGRTSPVKAVPVTVGDLGVDRDHLPWLRTATAVVEGDRLRVRT